MEIVEAIRKRRSIRQFKQTPVPRDVIESILEDGRWSPSGSNTQPWEMLILGGKTLADFKERVAEVIKGQSATQTRRNPDIPSPIWPEPYKSRAMSFMPRSASHQSNAGQQPLFDPAHLYGAPVAVIVYTERAVCPKAILDIGLLSQTIALAAMARGLGTCLMMYPVSYPEIIREMFSIPQSKLIAVCIAIGYPDMNAEINIFERTREPLNVFTRWFDA